jgi:O-antigen/teichoic acid export membrane protein
VFACLNLNPLFDAMHRQALAAALMVPADVLALAATAGLHATGHLTATAAGLVLLGKWALTALVHGSVFRSAYGFRLRRDRSRAGQLARSGRPLAVAALLVYIPLNGGVAVTRVTLGDAETAVYGVASQAALVCLLMAGLVARVVQPHIAGPYGLDRSFVKKLAAFLGLAFGGLWVGYAVSVYAVVGRLFPPHYAGVPGPAIVLGAAAVLFALAGVLGTYLVRFGRERMVRTAYAIACGLYLLSLSAGLKDLFGVSLLTLGASAALVALLALGCSATVHFTIN